MTPLTPHVSPDCPDLQSWCGYLDGSIDGAQAVALGTHLEGCDRCFATVTGLRRDLASEGDVATVRWIWSGTVFYAAAAVLAILWAGLWQAEHAPTPPPLTTGEAPPAGILGFAADGTRATPGVLRSPARILVVFTQFGGTPPTPLPAWAAGMFDPGQAGSLQATCGAVSEALSLRGAVLPTRYQTRFPPSAYVDAPAANRRRYVRDILRQVDAAVGLGQYDGDGDGVADFVVLFIAGSAHGKLSTPGSPSFGLGDDYAARRVLVSGHPHRGAWIVEADGDAVRQMCRGLLEASSP